MEAENWSLTTLREKLVKIDANVISHGRYVTFQLTEVAVRPGTATWEIPAKCRTAYPKWGLFRLCKSD